MVWIWGFMQSIKSEGKNGLESNRARRKHLDASVNITPVCTLFAFSWVSWVNLCSWASWLIVWILFKFSIRHFSLFISSLILSSGSGCYEQRVCEDCKSGICKLIHIRLQETQIYSSAWEFAEFRKMCFSEIIFQIFVLHVVYYLHSSCYL